MTDAIIVVAAMSFVLMLMFAAFVAGTFCATWIFNKSSEHGFTTGYAIGVAVMEKDAMSRIAPETEDAAAFEDSPIPGPIADPESYYGNEQ